MRHFTIVQTAAVTLALAILTSLAADDSKTKLAWPAGLPVYDHVVVVVEENKDYDYIVTDIFEKSTKQLAQRTTTSGRCRRIPA
jgi:hypothetical protein